MRVEVIRTVPGRNSAYNFLQAGLTLVLRSGWLYVVLNHTSHSGEFVTVHDGTEPTLFEVSCFGPVRLKKFPTTKTSRDVFGIKYGKVSGLK